MAKGKSGRRRKAFQDLPSAQVDRLHHRGAGEQDRRSHQHAAGQRQSTGHLHGIERAGEEKRREQEKHDSHGAHLLRDGYESVVPRHLPHYLLEEPTTGLYLHFSPHRIELSAAPGATRFSTAGDAILASSQIANQPHELVRVDA